MSKAQNSRLPCSHFQVCMGAIFCVISSICKAEWKTAPCFVYDVYFKQYSAPGGTNIVTPNPLACALNEVRAADLATQNLDQKNPICACLTTNHVSRTSFSNAKELPTITELTCYEKRSAGKFHKVSVQKTWLGYARPSSARTIEERWSEQSMQCEKARLKVENITPLEICSAWINSAFIPENWQRYIGVSTKNNIQAIEFKKISNFNTWKTSENNGIQSFEASVTTRAAKETATFEIQFENGKITEIKIQQQFTSRSPLHLFDISVQPRWTKVRFQHTAQSCRPVSLIQSDPNVRPNPLNLADCFNPLLNQPCTRGLECLSSRSPYTICTTLQEPYFHSDEYTKTNSASPERKTSSEKFSPKSGMQ